MSQAAVAPDVTGPDLATVRALRLLRSYLDDAGFHGAYKYLVTANLYPISATVFNGWQRAALQRFSTQIHDGPPGLALAACLTTRQPVPTDRLQPDERRVADALLAVGLLEETPEGVRPPWVQLLSVFDRYLLIDGVINFESGRMHDVYIGPDSYLLLYYAPVESIREHHRVLDLCTGTGIVGVGLSRFSSQVVSVDIADEALRLAHMNRVLNGGEVRITIRREDLRDTLADDEQFDYILCNPPYVAAPPGLDMPVYAQGPEADGLGYLRLLVDRAVEKLTPEGMAMFVVDLIGDARRPYYLDDLERIAHERGLFVEAFIDNKLDAEHQIPAYQVVYRRMRPELAPAEVEERVRRMFADLHAHAYYMTTLRLRRRPRGESGLRVFDRHRPTSLDGFFR